MKDLKDYIHLYIGCDVTDKLNSVFKMVGFTRSEVEPDKWLVICDAGPVFLEFYIEEIKLILRPLESMSVQEKSDYGIMSRPAKAGKNILPPFGGRMLNHFLNAHDPIIVKWLLDKGFDLFGLQAAGIAVYETEKV
jgi:hypothetical protein